MSFDLFYQPLRFDGSTERRQNPFTNEVGEFPVNAPLDADELAAVRALLDAACPSGRPDEEGCYDIRVADGGATEVFADGLAEGCMVALRGITPCLVHFLFELLRVGRWALLTDAEALVCSRADVRGLPEDFPPVRVCSDVAALGEALAPGFIDWAKYRDRVVGGGALRPAPRS